MSGDGALCQRSIEPRGFPNVVRPRQLVSTRVCSEREVCLFLHDGIAPPRRALASAITPASEISLSKVGIRVGIA